MDCVQNEEKIISSDPSTCLSIVLLVCSLNNIKVASAAPTYIFSDGFESGTLNAWTPYYGTLSINSQTVNSGFYSVESIEVGNNQNLYYHVSGGGLPNPIDFREYVYINSTTVPSTSGDYYQVGGFASIYWPQLRRWRNMRIQCSWNALLGSVLS